MTHEQIAAKRELLRNIAVTPIVLLIRAPLFIIFIGLQSVQDAIEWCVERLPGWTRDYPLGIAVRAILEKTHDQ